MVPVWKVNVHQALQARVCRAFFWFGPQYVEAACDALPRSTAALDGRQVHCTTQRFLACFGPLQ